MSTAIKHNNGCCFVSQQDVCCVCQLAKQDTTFMWKDVISVFIVLPSSAETLIGRGGKLYQLSVAYFLRNIPAKSYKNLRRIFDLQVKT